MKTHYTFKGEAQLDMSHSTLSDQLGISDEDVSYLFTLVKGKKTLHKIIKGLLDRGSLGLLVYLSFRGLIASTESCKKHKDADALKQAVLEGLKDYYGHREVDFHLVGTEHGKYESLIMSNMELRLLLKVLKKTIKAVQEKYNGNN